MLEEGVAGSLAELEQSAAHHGMALLLEREFGDARVLRSLDGVAARQEIEGERDRGEELLRSTGARSYEPEILEKRAALARALGAVESAELRAEAIDLYRAM